MSEAAGLHVVNPATGEPMAKSLALGPADVDGDGWTDVVVANDTVQNFFFHNLGDGDEPRFEEAAEAFGFAYDRNGNATGAMGVDWAHYRNDQNLGFVIGNFANEMSSVYMAQDDPIFFVDEAIGEGIGAPSRLKLTFGLFFFDTDLDGRLDLLQANGHIEDQIATVDPSQSYRQAAQLFWNSGDEGFVPLPEEASGDLAREIVGRGAAYADVDGDGDLDVVLTQVAGPPLLLRNDQDLGHHWLRLRLEGAPPNRDAIGARVELVAGGVTQRRQVTPTATGFNPWKECRRAAGGSVGTGSRLLRRVVPSRAGGSGWRPQAPALLPRAKRDGRPVLLGALRQAVVRRRVARHTGNAARAKGRGRGGSSAAGRHPGRRLGIRRLRHSTQEPHRKRARGADPRRLPASASAGRRSTRATSCSPAPGSSSATFSPPPGRTSPKRGA
ncbi:MAG: VCBS repeat-containing protein [Thermoanaerobaculia bacterium]